MDKLQFADERNTQWNYVSDGDRIDYGALTSPNQLGNWSNYDRIYMVGHGKFEENNFLGIVIGGSLYDPANISASNLFRFDYCGGGVITDSNPKGLIDTHQVSATWFNSVSEFFEDRSRE
jgi:hypothetical protein